MSLGSSLGVRFLCRGVLHQRLKITCSNASVSLYIQPMLSLSSKFGTRAFPKFASRSTCLNQSSILQFTRSAPWNATHLDHQRPPHAGGGQNQKPPGQPLWSDGPPSPIIFWSIFAANAGVFVAWYYAEGRLVGRYTYLIRPIFISTYTESNARE